ncbi:MAG: RNA polymerase sigma factor [Verrucomicrobiota bacterium]
MSENAKLDFNELVEAYYKPLYRFAYSLAKNEHEASDLTQQTFTIYAQKGDSLRDATKIKSWLFTTLYREFLRLRRKSAQAIPQENDILELEAPSVEPSGARLHDSNSALEALQQIDESYRAPLTLFYLKDLSYKEIAATLDIPIGTVMSRLSRGKAQLKSLLQSRAPT